jgi:hypothetical protein
MITIALITVFALFCVVTIFLLFLLFLTKQDQPKPPAVKLYFLHRGKEVTSVQTKISEKATLSFVAKDLAGNLAPVENVTWSTTDQSLCTVEPSADKMSAVVTPKGVTGLCKIQLSADAIIGEGEKVIVGEMDMEFLPGEAVTIELSGVNSPL